MNQSLVKHKKRIDARNGVLIAGLPGIGFVSKLAVDQAARNLKAEHFASLYSPHFPNQVIALKSGKLKPFSMKFYYKKTKKAKVVFLRGDLQPMTVEGQYEVCSKILNEFSSRGGRKVIAMAGYAVHKPSNPPKIYASSTSKAFLEEVYRQGAKPLPGNIPIVGMAGMLPALSRIYSMHGTCLLVETPGNAIDAEGAKELLSFLSKMLGEKIDYKELEERAKKAEKAVKNFSEQRTEEAPQISKADAAAHELAKREHTSYIR